MVVGVSGVKKRKKPHGLSWELQSAAATKENDCIPPGGSYAIRWPFGGQMLGG